jgi:hypothetical protein
MEQAASAADQLTKLGSFISLEWLVLNPLSAVVLTTAKELARTTAGAQMGRPWRDGSE